MNNHKTTTNSTNQIRWVILLLAIAVILPTVCLLFFMTQAVKNERLAVRQKLVDTYSKPAETFFIDMPNDHIKEITSYVSGFSSLRNSYWKTPIFSLHESIPATFIYDSNDILIWPVVNEVEMPEPNHDLFSEAYEWEFEKGNILKACQAYEKISKETDDDYTRIIADLATARCLAKSGKIDKAIHLAFGLMTNTMKPDIDKQICAELNQQARVLYAELMLKTQEEKYAKKIIRCMSQMYFSLQNPKTGEEYLTRPSLQSQIWALEKIIELAKQSNIESVISAIDNAEKELSNFKNALAIYESIPETNIFGFWQEGTVKTLNAEKGIYGTYITAGERKALCIVNVNFFESLAKEYQSEYDTTFCRVLDDSGRLIAGRKWEHAGPANSIGQLFSTFQPGQYFPGWKVELYFEDGVFGNAAKRTKLVYGWTAALVIGLMIIICGFAVKSVLRQAQVNRLKNDFIATVTHELKTPLASMRVLVDTLLEGSYNDQRQAVEYLQMISRENKRLTGLIDNFLTFSRMERNKQAFDIIDCPAENIVNDAAAAVKTKFSEKNCRFSVTIGDDLASILADKDAMVTVLVNLLDNACKYSGDEKEIELSVYNENENVCFTIKDNGIGMSPKVQKKIFERFYQADSKLSRTAEGCGLGLSIVKFIVDAHNGTINIESEPGKGSTFKIWIPK
ncbi:MAG: HAMP domain-containing histidine kinase [Phycisphaerae bacterium]|nr:HAMP domain-containing histidine kinase [Phycisphaerae bacterium]